MLIVDASTHWFDDVFTGTLPNTFNRSRGFTKTEEYLGLSAFTIMNPFKVDKKRFKKDSNFLKTIKNESYLYLYLKQGKGKGDDINTTFIVRDWKNKQIYNATHINTGLNEILAPLIDY